MDEVEEIMDSETYCYPANRETFLQLMAEHIMTLFKHIMEAEPNEKYYIDIQKVAISATGLRKPCVTLLKCTPEFYELQKKHGMAWAEANLYKVSSETNLAYINVLDLIGIISKKYYSGWYNINYISETGLLTDLFETYKLWPFNERVTLHEYIAYGGGIYITEQNV